MSASSSPKQSMPLQSMVTALDAESLAMVLAALPTTTDLVRACMTCHGLHAVMENALRLRSPRDPSALPKEFASWTEKLIFDERRKAVNPPTLSINKSHGAAIFGERVFVWGTEYVSPSGRDVPGLLGHGIREVKNHIFENDIRMPTPLPGIDRAVSVSCGREHTLALTADGQVFAFGNAEWGQCGSGPGRCRMDFFPPDAEPPFIRGKVVLCQPSTFGHLNHGYWKMDTLFGIENDIPVTRCAECSNCPHDKMPISDEKMATNYDDATDGMTPPAFLVKVPKPVPTPVKVFKVAAGGLHSLLLGEDGYAYSFGCAYEGRLGLGPVASPPTHVFKPTKITLGALATAPTLRIVDISAGMMRSLLVRSDGSVVGFGGCSPEELGLGLEGNPATPKVDGDNTSNWFYSSPVRLPLPAGVRITAASIGEKHGLLVGDNGSVYAFGSGEGGCLGFGADETDKHLPTKIGGVLEGVRIVKAAAGCTHSLVVSQEGAVYEFGQEHTMLDWDEDFGDEEEIAARPSFPRGQPTLISEHGNFGWTSRKGVDFLTDVRALDIAAGMGTSSIRTASGLASFGGHENDTFAEFTLDVWPSAAEGKTVKETTEEAIAKKEADFKVKERLEKFSMFSRMMRDEESGEEGEEGGECCIA